MLKYRTDVNGAIGSFWESGLTNPRADRQLVGNAQFDVAIVGAGFAGLSAALKLSHEGLSVCLLEAEHVGFGASGRNGGLCCLGGSKLSERQLIWKYGLEEARKFVSYQIAGIDLVRHRLDSWGVSADRHSSGEVYLAHRPRDLRSLEAQKNLFSKKFGIETELLSKQDLVTNGLNGPGFHGGLHIPHGFALNPMKYVFALAEQVRAAGGKIFGKSPVLGLHPSGEGWRLDTENGFVQAKQVLLAGNAYSNEDVPPWTHGRTLPVMSSILVTRPLTQSELGAQGWTSDVMATDTRTLLHYFRLLPDRRFLFGTRGGVFETTRAIREMRTQARFDFEAMFPAWASVETEFNWHGHVCMSRKRTPFVGQVPTMPGVFAALGWHGSGIAMASISGEKVAAMMTGALRREDLPKPLQKTFPKFLFPSLRKFYLLGAYWLYERLDR